MQALVLEEKGVLALRDIDLPLSVGPDDVKIAIHTVGEGWDAAGSSD